MKTGEHRTKSDGDTAIVMEHSDITGSKLRELFRRVRVVRKYDPPSDEGFARLAQSLNALRTLIEKYIGPMTDHARRQCVVYEGISMLQMALPGFIEDIEARVENTEITASGPNAECAVVQARQFLGSRWEPGIDALRRLRAAVTGMEDHAYFWKPSLPPPLDQWHEFVHLLADDFRAAMRETNPGLSLGLSMQGPVGRYCVLAIEVLTGVKTTTEAVVVELRRQTRPGTRPAP
jgi:hypothetical protein